MRGFQDILLDVWVCLWESQEQVEFMQLSTEYGIYGLERNIRATEAQADYKVTGLEISSELLKKGKMRAVELNW